jgi:hypothetical protein
MHKYTVPVVGEPPVMTDEEVETNRREAFVLLDDEASRTRSGFSPGSVIEVEREYPPRQPTPATNSFLRPAVVPDPAIFAGTSSMGPVPNHSDADFVRSILPELAHMSDSYLTQHSLDKLQKYVNMIKKQSEDKVEKNLESRMAQNLENAIKRPVSIGGQDNRYDKLHPGRFLPGAAVPLEKSWLEARKLWGRDPAEAVAEFDLLALGLPGCIPAKAWELLHAPGSREISIKMFTVANVARASDGMKTVASQTDEGLVLRESLKELSEMSELKTAFRNMKLAAQLVRPWDWSFVVIESFLISTDYLESQLKGVKRAPVLASFLDHVLRVNATNWLQSKPFMDMTSIKALWDPWWAGHRGEAKQEPDQQHNAGGQKNNNRQNKGKNQEGHGNSDSNNKAGQQAGQNAGGGRRGRWTPAGNFTFAHVHLPPPDFSGAPSEKTICRQYNENSCSNTYNTCVKNSRYGPFRLYHLCNHTEMKNGKLEVCAGKHPKPEHK